MLAIPKPIPYPIRSNKSDVNDPAAEYNTVVTAAMRRPASSNFIRDTRCISAAVAKRDTIAANANTEVTKLTWILPAWNSFFT
ncbi:hypothetical protein D3C85_1817530 [compost metagenome]